MSMVSKGPCRQGPLQAQQLLPLASWLPAASPSAATVRSGCCACNGLTQGPLRWARPTLLL